MSMCLEKYMMLVADVEMWCDVNVTCYSWKMLGGNAVVTGKGNYNADIMSKLNATVANNKLSEIAAKAAIKTH